MRRKRLLGTRKKNMVCLPLLLDPLAYCSNPQHMFNSLREVRDHRQKVASEWLNMKSWLYENIGTGLNMTVPQATYTIEEARAARWVLYKSGELPVPALGTIADTFHLYMDPEFEVVFRLQWGAFCQ